MKDTTAAAAQRNPSTIQCGIARNHLMSHIHRDSCGSRCASMTTGVPGERGWTAPASGRPYAPGPYAPGAAAAYAVVRSPAAAPTGEPVGGGVPGGTAVGRSRVPIAIPMRRAARPLRSRPRPTRAAIAGTRTSPRAPTLTDAATPGEPSAFMSTPVQSPEASDQVISCCPEPEAWVVQNACSVGAATSVPPSARSYCGWPATTRMTLSRAAPSR